MLNSLSVASHIRLVRGELWFFLAKLLFDLVVRYLGPSHFAKCCNKTISVAKQQRSSATVEQRSGTAQQQRSKEAAQQSNSAETQQRSKATAQQSSSAAKQQRSKAAVDAVSFAS